MPQSLTKIYLHIIFSTKYRRSLITDDVQTQLYPYMAGILKTYKSTPVLIGGMPDHVHILTTLSKNYATCKLIEEVKKSSSKWVKTLSPYLRAFQWQNGYGAFSIGQSQINAVTKYIERQKQHHRKMTFKEEFLKFLEKYQVEYDERYLWD